jgi:APA family basic amino acid/polyamine antiporter
MIPESMQRDQLVRGLNLPATIALVVGSVIGTGVFFKASVMAQLVGSPGLVLTAWVAAGLLSLAGALTWAELGAMIPKAGGEYNYIRTAFGDALGFLAGWMRCIVGTAGVSALGVGFAMFLSAVIPMPQVWAAADYHIGGMPMHWQFGMKELVAIAAILFFGLINCFGLLLGARVQMLLTTIKVTGILILALGAFLFAPAGSAEHWRAPVSGGGWPGLSAFGAAMLAALWACDGWAFMPMVAGEVKDPGRNVPRGLAFGVLIVLALYWMANASYLWALPFAEVMSSNSTQYRDALPVASKSAQTFLGGNGPAVLSIMFAISAVGALNGVILSKSRVPFAMAQDGLFFPKLGEVSQSARVPALAILALSVWSALLALSGTYDQLTDLTIMYEWVFYGLGGVGVFVLRRTMPDAPRPYRVWGYPLVPAAFICVAAWLVGNSFYTRPVEAAFGGALILLGLPIYAYFRRAIAVPVAVTGD